MKQNDIAISPCLPGIPEGQQGSVNGEFVSTFSCNAQFRQLLRENNSASDADTEYLDVKNDSFMRSFTNDNFEIVKLLVTNIQALRQELSSLTGRVNKMVVKYNQINEVMTTLHEKNMRLFRMCARVL